MPVDADAQAFLDRISGGPAIHELGVDVARALSTEMRTMAGPDVEEVEERTIPSAGGEVTIRIYTPDGDGPFPVLVLIHGGGFIMGSTDSVDGHARRFCFHGGCIVVSVDYRLAPDVKFPVPLEDCYSAAAWVAEHASDINADPTRIAISGESTGANLAAATVLLARDRGGPRFVGQVLVVPLLDRDFETSSWAEYGDLPPGRDTMAWFWEQYLASDDDAASPYAMPLRADDLSGLPPTMIITAEADPLRDDGETYAERIAAAGGEVQVERFDGMIHMFYLLAGILPKGDQAYQRALAAVKQFFAVATTSA